jgi:ent-kaurenoic acid hydroxylase
VTSSLRAWAEESSSARGKGGIVFLTELRRMTFKIIVQIFLGGADEPTTRVLERSYTDLNYGMRAMAINLPGFAYAGGSWSCCRACWTSGAPPGPGGSHVVPAPAEEWT